MKARKRKRGPETSVSGPPEAVSGRYLDLAGAAIEAVTVVEPIAAAVVIPAGPDIVGDHASVADLGDENADRGSRSGIGTRVGTRVLRVAVTRSDLEVEAESAAVVDAVTVVAVAVVMTVSVMAAVTVMDAVTVMAVAVVMAVLVGVTVMSIVMPVARVSAGGQASNAEYQQGCEEEVLHNGLPF